MHPPALKTFGQALLVCTLFAQWFYLESARETGDNIRNSIEYSALSDIRATGLLGHYVTSTNLGSIKEAAKEKARSTLLLMVPVSANAEEFESTKTKLEMMAASVADLQSYNSLENALNSLTTVANEATRKRLTDLSRSRKIAWWSVLLLLAASGALIGVAEFKEKKSHAFAGEA